MQDLYVLQELKNLENDKLEKVDVVNNLTTSTIGKALDASQGKALNDKITLDQTTKSNFDFIENKVVQDGLVGSVTLSQNYADFNGLVKVRNLNTSVVNVLFECRNNSSNSTKGFLVFATQTFISLYLYGDSGRVFAKEFKDINLLQENIVILNKHGGLFTVSINGKQEIISHNSFVEYYSDVKSYSLADVEYLYNRTLTQAEINHNFNVLTNTSSTNQLSVTDSTGTKMPLLFASDTSHVEGRGGVLQDQINADFYKQFCKEFTSDGSDITVSNGMRGYVNSFNMSGQTVKNICKPIMDSYTSGGCATIKNQNSVTCTGLGNSSYITIKTGDTVNFKQGDKYYCFGKVRVNELGATKIDFQCVGGYKTVTITSPINKEYQLKGLVSVNGDFTGKAISVDIWYTDAQSQNGKIIEVSDFAVIDLKACGLENKTEAELDKIFSGAYIPFGLNSTKACITNNGIKYNFYGNDGNVITLGGVGGVNDTLTLNDDGSGTLVQNTKEVIFNGSETTWLERTTENYATMCNFYIAISDNKFNVSPICSHFNGRAHDVAEVEGILIGGSNYLHIRILKSKLSTPDVNGFKAWLQANPITARYQLATPIVTTIPKEKMTTVLTADKSNILSCSEGVRASGFKVNIPVDKFGEKSDKTYVDTQDTNLSNQITVLSNDRGYLGYSSVADIDTVKLSGRYSYTEVLNGVTTIYLVDVIGGADRVVQKRTSVWDSNGLGRGIASERIFVDGTWGSWKQLATTEITKADFPYASGFECSNDTISSHIKYTDTIIEIAVSIAKSDRTAIVDNSVIATMPLGLIPLKRVTLSGRGINENGSHHPVFLSIREDGRVRVNSNVSINEIVCTGSFLKQ